VVTTAYDHGLEQAFERAGEPFDMVSYVAEGVDRGRFVHTPPDGRAKTIDKPNKYLGHGPTHRGIAGAFGGGAGGGLQSGWPCRRDCQCGSIRAAVGCRGGRHDRRAARTRRRSDLARIRPDAHTLVTASDDGTAREWAVNTRQSTVDLRGHRSGVSAAEFSPDGARVASASWDGTARLWDTRGGSPIAELRGHTGLVSALAFSRDGTQLATASDDHTVRVWQAATGQPLLELRGHAGP
jgi:hypothetical protein